MNRFAAGIVLYNPDMNRLNANLSAVAFQVSVVYCYNNGVEHEKELTELLKKFSNVRLIGCGENKGIAIALQSILVNADKDGFEWVLTLDQDSVMPQNSVEVFSQYTKIPMVGMLCPVMYDQRRKDKKLEIQDEEITEVSFCITSGALTNILAWKKVGGYDEKLFIGLVDNEFSHRIVKSGYKIIRINKLIMNHELGNLTPSKHEKLYLKVGDKLHIEAIKKLSYRREVSPMRLYYATRNMVYLKRKYPQDDVDAWSTKRMLFNSISSIFRGKHKIKLLSCVLRGVIDGEKLRRINLL